MVSFQLSLKRGHSKPLSSVQNEKIAPILCANSHNECSPVFALKFEFTMKVYLTLPFKVKHIGKVIMSQNYITECIGRLLNRIKI